MDSAHSAEIQNILQEALTPLPNFDPYNPALFTAPPSQEYNVIESPIYELK